MAAFSAEFTWPLAPTAATLSRYAEVLAAAAGYPCQWELLSAADPMTIEAALSFPRVTKNNLVRLFNGGGKLDFAPIPFFWSHSLASIRALGGTVLRALPSDSEYVAAVPWQRLPRWDRVRIVMGLGPWVR